MRNNKTSPINESKSRLVTETRKNINGTEDNRGRKQTRKTEKAEQLDGKKQNKTGK